MKQFNHLGPLRLAAAAAGVAGLGTAALAGPEWTESPDAGSIPPDAQPVIGTGPLMSIRGELTGGGPRGAGDFEDMYEIEISDPASFQVFVTSDALTSTSFDTRLWLFDLAGRGLLANDDSSFSPVAGGAGFENFATDMTGSGVVSPGRYFLAITGADNAALDNNGNPIFDFATVGEVSGPDGSPLEIGSWTGGELFGEYLLAIEGASFIPAPGAVALFGLSGAAALRRRR